MKKIKIAFAIVMMISGMGIIAYPFISNKLAEKNASVAIQEYQNTVDEMDQKKLDAAKEAASKYNEQLSNVLLEDASEENDTTVSYVDMLGLGEGIGYITIPKIDVNLPIYEGTNDDVLSNGIGHMSQSSFPIGGESTHCVLTGHRGMPGAVLFTNLDQLQVGDYFFLHVLDEILAYQVDQIKVVEPEETSDLEIIPGEDYCTLITCTPYAVNTHRLLVRGVRAEYSENDSRVQYQELQTGTLIQRMVDAWQWIVVSLTVVLGGEALLLFLIIKRRRRKEQ